MKVISIWNPYAILLVRGFKNIETRGWPAPRTIIKKRIGIASTKIIRPEQRSVLSDEVFRFYYEKTGLSCDLNQLPNGYLLGTAVLSSCDIITDDDLNDITEEEQIYGIYETGRYAWRFREQTIFDTPIPVRGAQGIWELDDDVFTSKVVSFDKNNSR
jgi:hypothetical protein